MYMAMLGMAAFMDWRGGLKTAEGIMWFGIAGTVGWPFAIALSAPFLLEEAALALISNAGLETAIWRVVDGTVRSLLVLVSFSRARIV
jgi:alpha-1,2-mannosyltransferase